MKKHQSLARGAALLAAVLTATSGTASAQDVDLKAQMNQLAKKLEALQKQLDAQTASPAPANTAQAAPPPADVVVKGDMPGSFKIPGTNTSVKIGGFGRLDVVKDFGGGENGAVGIVPLTPLAGSAQSQRAGQFSMNARQSRLYLSTLTPTTLGALTTYLEGDFYGAGGNETGTNSSGFRLRQAYAQMGSWLVGQTWTNLVELSTYPETVDFEGGNGTLATNRTPQVRYTTKWGSGNQFSFSLENPIADISGTVAPTFAAAVGTTSTTTLSKVPDVTAKYVYNDSWGTVAVSGLGRRMTFNNIGSPAINGFVGQSSTTTAAWAIESKFNTFGKDSLQLHYVQGPGVGRYLLAPTPTTGAVINGNGKLDAISQKAYMIGYRHFWTPTLRSNLIFGRVDADYRHPAVPVATVSSSRATYLNLIWEPLPGTTIGVELQRTNASNDMGQTGSNNRLLTSFQAGF